MGKGNTHRQNDIRGQACPRVLRTSGTKSLEMSRQACNKANEETYLSPLLVNMKLIQPYRE